MDKLLALAVATVIAASVPAGAQAWGPANPRTVFNFAVLNAPKGTVCGVEGAVGKVKTSRFMGNAGVVLRGNAHVGDVFCQLPDGRRIVTELNKTGIAQMPQAISIQLSVNPTDGYAHVMVGTRQGNFESRLDPSEAYAVR